MLLRVGVAALDHGIACEMKYTVMEATVKYHPPKMFCIDSNNIRGQVQEQSMMSAGCLDAELPDRIKS